MNGFGFFSLRYSLRIDSASLCESAFSKKKILISTPFSFPVFPESFFLVLE